MKPYKSFGNSDEKHETENEAVNVFCKNLFAKTKVDIGGNSKENAKFLERFTTENSEIACKKIIYKTQVHIYELSVQSIVCF